MSSNTFRRTVIGAVAVAGALSLAACNSGESASVTTPAGQTTTTSSAAPETSTTTESSAPETSTTTTEPSETTTSEASKTSTSEATKPATGPTEVSDPDGTFKLGEPAVIKDDDDVYRLTPTSLEVAPASDYNEARLKKANGTVYYLKFDVTPIKVKSSYFGTNSINGLFFHPEIGASVKNAKRVYGDTDACESDSKKLAAGETGSSCYIYQIPGAKVSNVVYNDYDHNIRWTK